MYALQTTVTEISYVIFVFVKLLTYWYTHHSVECYNGLGECFNVLCEVRQGGVSTLVSLLVRFLYYIVIISAQFSGVVYYYYYTPTIFYFSGSCTGLQ